MNETAVLAASAGVCGAPGERHDMAPPGVISEGQEGQANESEADRREGGSYFPSRPNSVPPLESCTGSPRSSRPPTPRSERSSVGVRGLASQEEDSSTLVSVVNDGAHNDTEEPDKSGKHACGWGTCRAVFGTLDELNSHLSRDHVGRGKSTYRCEWRGCARAAQGEEGIFKQRQKLQRHLQVHTHFRPFVCTVCHAAFGEATGLALHMRTHSGQRPFACDWPGCDKRFATSGSLVNHLRVHRGDRPFACPICGRAFAEASNLSKHKKTHSGERRYACMICHKSYGRSDQLARHMRLHESQTQTRQTHPSHPLSHAQHSHSDYESGPDTGHFDTTLSAEKDTNEDNYLATSHDQDETNDKKIKKKDQGIHGGPGAVPMLGTPESGSTMDVLADLTLADSLAMVGDGGASASKRAACRTEMGHQQQEEQWGHKKRRRVT